MSHHPETGPDDAGDAASAIGRTRADREQDRIADHLRDEPQPIDPRLIAGGGDLIGAANHTSTGPDPLNAASGPGEGTAASADEGEAARPDR